jgi:hypothetical protein
MLDLDLNNYSKWKEDLIRDIRYHDYRDDLDWNGGEFPEIPSRPVAVLHPVHGYTITQSDCNLDNIRDYFLKIKDKCKCIVEIGVDCNGTSTERTSTRIFLDNKLDDTIYFGVDIEDKSYLNDESKNIFTLKVDSSDIQSVIDFINSKGVSEIDFLFIDGWHSINQVMREWEYTKYLSDFGIVGFHDTSIHPGPHAFLKALDRKKWNVVENPCSDNLNDWGVGFVWRNNTQVKIISHRGNLAGPSPLLENNPEYIDDAIDAGFDVEVDVRCIDNDLYLGHDQPQYLVSMDWLIARKDHLWLHCKNLKSLDIFSSSSIDFHYFWHETDRYTFTSKGIGWVLVGQFPFSKSVIVLPESIDLNPYSFEYIQQSYGICTDKPLYYKSKL